MPAGGLLGFFLRLLHQHGRRSRRIARRRRHGTGGRRRHYRNRGDNTHQGHRYRHYYIRRLRWLESRRRRQDIRRGCGDGAGPSGTHAEPPAPVEMPEAQPLPASILAGPAAPNLYADEEMEIDDPALAAPPPPTPCPIHGWACPRLVHVAPIEEEAELVAPAAPSPPRSPDLPSPTPAHEPSDAGNAPSSAGLGTRLSNGHSNGVAPGTHLPGGSSSEEEEDAAQGRSAGRR